MSVMQILQSRYLLWPIRNSLYGKENIFFDPESHYKEYDGMLLRSIFYARFGVHEIAFEAKLRFSDQGETKFFVFGYPECASLLGGVPALEELARSRLVGNRDLATIDSTPTSLEITFPMRHFNSKANPRISHRSIRREWCTSILKEWALPNQELILRHSRADILLNPEDTWILSRRISEMDTDLSEENPPQVYRWREVSQSGFSTYDELDENSLTSMFEAVGITMPTDSRRIAKIREDSTGSSSFLLLRFDHLVPDPQAESKPDSIEQIGQSPRWANQGFIRVEGDFLELLIDAGNRKVLSEFRKWRSVEV